MFPNACWHLGADLNKFGLEKIEILGVGVGGCMRREHGERDMSGQSTGTETTSNKITCVGTLKLRRQFCKGV